MRTTEAPAVTEPAALAEGLSFSYGERTAIDGLTLTVPRGSLFGLLGPNGSGKSTLLSLLAGLQSPDSGSVRVFGHAPSPEVRSRIGFLFQETSLDPLMTVGETLSLHGRLYALPVPLLRRRLDELLATMGLADRARSLVRSLSGGMRRRLELARALLPGPELLLLDEPTTGLDPDSEQALWSHLLQINSEGVTILLATNNVLESERYCQTVAFIHDGQLVAQGSPSALKAGLKRDAVWAEGRFTQEFVEKLGDWPNVGRLTWAPPVLHLTVDSASAFVPRLFQAAGTDITAVRLREATLEDAYFDIVGSAIASTEETR